MQLNINGNQQILIKKIFAYSGLQKIAQSEKEADAELIANWDSFKNLKGKTFGDIRSKASKEFNVVPSFLAVCYRHDQDGAARYVNAKYGGKVQ